MNSPKDTLKVIALVLIIIGSGYFAFTYSGNRSNSLGLGQVINSPDIQSIVFKSTLSTASKFITTVPPNGSIDGSKAVFNIKANSDIIVTELKFNVTGTPTAISSARIDPTTTAVVNGVAHFTGLNLEVPTGNPGLDVETYFSYAPVGATGVSSGSTSQITLSYIKYIKDGNTISLNLTMGPSPVMISVASKPIVGMTQPTNALAVGNVEVIGALVTAFPTGSIKLNSIPIDLTALNATINPAQNSIVVKDASGTVIPTSNIAFSSSTGGIGKIIFNNGGYTIPAGATKVFKIFVPVASIGSSGLASITTKLAQGAAFRWTDIAGGATVAQVGTSLIYGYPTTSAVVTGQTVSNYTVAQVAAHNTTSDCWIIITLSGTTVAKVYDVDSYIPVHPGGMNNIAARCGTDASVAFNTQGHSNTAKNILAGFYIGNLVP